MSTPDELRRMLGGACAGRGVELVAHPMIRLARGSSGTMTIEGVGRYTIGLSADGTSAHVSDISLRGAALPAFTADVGVRGGTSSVLASGGKEFAFVLSSEPSD